MQQPTGNSGSPDTLLTAQQAAEILNVPASWILSQARSGAVPCIRLSRYVRFQRSELLEFIEQQSVKPKRGRL